MLHVILVSIFRLPSDFRKLDLVPTIAIFNFIIKIVFGPSYYIDGIVRMSAHTILIVTYRDQIGR